MYNIYQIVKPNGEKLAWLEEEEALEKAAALSKQVGENQVIFYKLECEEDEPDKPGEEWVVHTKTYQNGEVISQNDDRYQAPQYVPAPGTKGSKKKGLTPEQKAEKDKAKAEAKAARDAAKAQRAEDRAAAKAERDKLKAERKAQREADKANRPSKGPRSRLPDDGVIHMLRPDNPKRVGSAAHPRYALYQDGMSVKEYKALNKDFGSIDLAWDIDHGFIKVTQADGSDLPAVETVGEPSAEELAEAYNPENVVPSEGEQPAAPAE